MPRACIALPFKETLSEAPAALLVSFGVSSLFPAPWRVSRRRSLATRAHPSPRASRVPREGQLRARARTAPRPSLACFSLVGVVSA